MASADKQPGAPVDVFEAATAAAEADFIAERLCALRADGDALEPPPLPAGTVGGGAPMGGGGGGNGDSD